MTGAARLRDSVRDAWSEVPAPPAEDLQLMEWGWGAEAARTFAGVAPMDVDVTSRGFHAATPLLELPPRAAAAYLGTYLFSLLDGLDFQLTAGIYHDALTRAHTLTCLMRADFWQRVVRLLPVECKRVLGEVANYLAGSKDALPLTDEQADLIVRLAGAELATG